jgi:hypothetical protein
VILRLLLLPHLHLAVARSSPSRLFWGYARFIALDPGAELIAGMLQKVARQRILAHPNCLACSLLTSVQAGAIMRDTDLSSGGRRPDAIRDARERLTLLRKMQRCLEAQMLAPTDKAKLKRIKWDWFSGLQKEPRAYNRPSRPRHR